MTETNPSVIRGWVFYDAACEFCLRLARRAEHVLGSRGLLLEPLQTSDAAARLKIAPTALMEQMHLLTADGRVFGGADAVVEIARRIWWARPLAWLARVPGMRRVMRSLYARVAANRYCAGGACRPPARRRTRRHGATSFFEMP